MLNFLKKIYVKHLRSRANSILHKYPVFHINDQEFLDRCLVLEQNFAGIVLGYCIDGVKAKIIRAHSLCDPREADSLSLGHFGEIVYQYKDKWIKTGLYGFFDQCSRIWCCGKISDTLWYNGEYFYPYCIEPVFENLIFVKSARLLKQKNGSPILEVRLRSLFKFKILESFLQRNLYSFASRFEKTRLLTKINILKRKLL